MKLVGQSSNIGVLTPLLLCIQHRQPEMVRLLLQAKADPDPPPSADPAGDPPSPLLASCAITVPECLRQLLEAAGYEVCAEARNGLEAVELAASEDPDLAILDVKMPELDGIEAARRILERRSIPIVVVTAYSQEELVSRAVEAGVFGYLVKPFREEDLLPAIAAARARHAATFSGP